MKIAILRLLIAAAISLPLSLLALAQAPAWPVIPLTDLTTDKASVEAGSPAEIILWEESISHEFSGVVHDVYFRAKVFDDRGIPSLNRIVLDFDESAKLNGFAVRITRPGDQPYEIPESSIIEEVVASYRNEKRKRRSYIIPRVVSGSIVECRWRVNSLGMNLDNLRLNLQKYLPAREIVYRFKISRKSNPLKMLRFNVKDGDYETRREDDTTIVRVLNAKAVIDEPHVPPPGNYIPSLLLYYDSIVTTDVEKYWEKHGRDLRYVLDPVDAGAVRGFALKLTENAPTPEEKISAIFNFCRTRIKNISYDADTTDKERKKTEEKHFTSGDVLNSGLGNSVQIDYLFTSMAKSIGLEVRFVYTGDRRNFFFLKSYTQRGLVHYSGLAVKTPSGWHFTSPGAKAVAPGKLSWYSEGQEALLVGDKDAEWVTLPISGPSFNTTRRSARLTLAADGTLEGTVKVVLGGYNNTDFKEAHRSDTPEKLVEALVNELKDQYGTGSVSDIAVKNLDANAGDVEIKYKISIPKYALKSGSRLIFKPAVFDAYSDPTFTVSKRDASIYFARLSSEFDEIDIAIPAGYRVESLPGAQNFGGGETPLRYASVFSYDVSTRIVKLRRLTAIGENGRILYPPSSYSQIKEVYDRKAQADAQVVPLTIDR